MTPRARRLRSLALAAMSVTLASCASVADRRPSTEPAAPRPVPRASEPAASTPPAAQTVPEPSPGPIASVPRQSPPASAQPPRATTPATPPRTTDARPRSGGFYLDDGPGDQPVDVGSLREPEPRLEPLHRFANNPYTVFGQTYVPERQIRASVSRGVASWYGRRFHGLATSSGEPYDMYQLTAAHPTLPIPSYARVTNVANGRSVVVRVNDRGPFLHGRAMDLSYAAAAKLGYVDQGSALVEIESLNPAVDFASRPPASATTLASRAPAPASTRVLPPPASATPASPTLSALAADAKAGNANLGFPVVEDRAGLFIQLGAFQSRDNADSFLTRLIFQTDEYAGLLRVVQRDGLHRIVAGPFRDRGEVTAAATRFAAQR